MPQIAQKGKEGQVRAKINQKLTESGEKERFVNRRDFNLEFDTESIVKEKGIDNVTVDDLIEEVTPRARAMVPDDVKRELFQRIKAFITDKSELP